MSQKKHKNPLIVLLDTHAIIHRAYHALPDFASSKGEPTGALYGLSTMLLSIVVELKPDYIIACYDLPGKTFRDEVYEDYKGGRKKTDQALVDQIIRSRDLFRAFSIPMYDKPGFEADDMLGTIVEEMKSQPVDIVIASGDMDTMQLIDGKKVKVFTLKKGIKDTVLYDEDAVKERFGFMPALLPDYKGLRGDTSDNIVGIKGIGEKTATTLIQTFGTIEDMYVALEKGKKNDDEAFKKVGISPRIIGLLREGEEEARFSKMLATIRRDAPINFTLPTKRWSEEVSIDSILSLYKDFEFRSLGEKARQALRVYEEKNTEIKPEKNENGENNEAKENSEEKPKINVKKKTKKSEQTNNKDQDLNAEDSDEYVGKKKSSVDITSGLFASDIDPDEFKKTALAVWIIDSNYTNPNLDEILQAGEAKDFEEAKKNIFERLKKSGLQKVYDDIELPLVPILNEMEKRGVKIDKEYLAKLSKTYHAQLDKIEKEIWEHAGGEFNIGSPKQLGEILFDKLGLTVKGLKKTAGGARSTKESELQKMIDLHPIIALILNHRELQKLLGTYIDTIPEKLDSNDRLHTHYVQTGAATGRMASVEPNLQNIPIKTELGRAIRHAFIAEEGFKLVAIDFSQIELRIAAFLSNDKKLIEIFTSGQDVHQAVAAQVFKVPLEEVTKEMRRKAKVINFGILYGMGVNALKTNLGGTRDEAQQFYTEYFNTFTTLATYLENVKKAAAENGYTETFFGRRRFFEGINSRLPFIRASAERMAINAPIQGTQADLIKIAMKKIDTYLEEQKLRDSAHLELQVHDELVYEIRADMLNEIAGEIKNIMETVMTPKETSGIPIIANASAGDNWGEMEKMK